jgi:hypothetical protein
MLVYGVSQVIAAQHRVGLSSLDRTTEGITGKDT